MDTNFKSCLQKTVTSMAGLCGKIKKAMSPNIACCLFTFM